MINEENNKIVLDLLKTANIIFETTESFIYTSWKDKKSNDYAVIIFSESEWIIFSSIIDLKKIKNEMELDKKLLKLNLKYLGFKFAIDKKGKNFTFIPNSSEFIRHIQNQRNICKLLHYS